MSTDQPYDAVRKRPGGRSARIRAATLHAALEELAEVGYAAFSLDAVARRAGVHKTTLYRRWGTPDDLLLEAMIEAAQESVPIPDLGALRSDLLAYLEAIVENLRSPLVDAAARAFAAEAPRNPRLAETGRRFWARRFALARPITERAIERGELPESTDPDQIIELLLGPVYLRLLVTNDVLDRSFVENTVNFVVAGAGAAKRERIGDITPVDESGSDTSATAP
ncbi:TetR/AcrR family transcriptional regulator [Nocardia sp. CA-119907]|uniref:TetR/AcrR family transcriptional regulator n=1 Tax=Nocardia sp. CA-119907 TaxID=3239973 RepID=UPI003D97F4E3